MKGKIFSIIFLLFIAIVSPLRVLAQTTNNYTLTGGIITPLEWKGGSIWKTLFGNLPNRINQPRFDAQGNLSGYFWIGSAGWVTFGYGNAKITCTNDIIDQTAKNKNAKCPVSGKAWSNSSGWIYFTDNNGGHINNNQLPVSFNPNSGNLEGFAWSSSLGWIPIFTGKIFDLDNPNLNINNRNTPNVEEFLTNDWYKTEAPKESNVNINFIGKVAVLGNIAGSKIFDISNQHSYKNQDIHSFYQGLQHVPLINQIRKNISIITRNIKINQHTTSPLNNFVYNEEKDYCIVNSHDARDYTDYCNTNTGNDIYTINQKIRNDFNNIKTIIIKGHDIIIDGDFNAEDNEINFPDASKMKAIIALKGNNGEGGNIYITKNTNKIFGYLVAEGSIFSGEKEKVDSNIQEKIYINQPGYIGNSGLPSNQLYINGAVISKNTIGGNSKEDRDKCPVLHVGCNNEARKYDFSYFRNYIYKNLTGGNPSSLPDFRRDVDANIKEATVVIDYNSAILSNPPPGLENVR